jgi:probable phosphoglycerate mutase
VTRRRLKVVVEADGGARGNPGPAGYGAVVREAATGEVLVERAATIGVATNNVAEYSGLIAGLRAAADVGAVEVEVRMDSKLVVEQMSGRWQIKHPNLRPLAAEAAALVARFDRVRLTWIPREENRRADALANAAMDGVPAPEVDLSSPADRPAPGNRWHPPDTGPATRLVLVRHGETRLTTEGRYSGRGDVPLTPRGRAQAVAAAARVAAAWGDVAVVLTSPLTRCVETAESVAAALGGVAVRVEPGLVECDFGRWEGLSYAQVSERWPRELADWLADTAVAPPGGESFATVSARVGAVVERVRADLTGRTVVLVSHVTPIKLVLRDALAAGDALLYRLYLDPAGISLVDYWPDGGVAVRGVNDTAHVRAD